MSLPLTARIQTRPKTVRAIPLRKGGKEWFLSRRGLLFKGAYRLTKNPARSCKPVRTPRTNAYDAAVKSPSIKGMELEVRDCPCGRRLAPVLPGVLANLETHGHLQVEEEVRESRTPHRRPLASRRGRATSDVPVEKKEAIDMVHRSLGLCRLKKAWNG